MAMRGLQRSSEAKSGHRDSFASSTHPRLHAWTMQGWRGAGGRLPYKAAATTWLPLAHAVVPPHEASAGGGSGLRAREADDLSKSVGDQCTHAMSTHARIRDLFTTIVRESAA